MIDTSIGFVGVRTTTNRGFTSEELAEQCADKIISVSDTADPVIQQQARAFRDQVSHLVKIYLDQAVQSDRTTVYNALQEAGQPQLAELVRRI